MAYAVIYTKKLTRRFKTTDHLSIYEFLMQLTNDNHEISSEVASWCEIADIDEEREYEEYGFNVVIEGF